MSTKLYDFFRWKTIDIHYLYDKLQRFRQEVALPIIKKDFNYILAKHSSTFLDDYLLLQTEDKNNDYFNSMKNKTVFSFMTEEYEKILYDIEYKKMPNPLWDFEWNIMIFFHDGKMYGKNFSEYSKFNSLFETHFKDEKESFEYYDNTDRPEGISEDEWTERRIIWDAILDNEPPINRGLNFQISGMPKNIFFNDFWEMEPEEKDEFDLKRARAIERSICWRAYSSSIKIPEKMRTSEYLIFMRNFESCIELTNEIKKKVVPFTKENICYLTIEELEKKYGIYDFSEIFANA